MYQYYKKNSKKKEYMTDINNISFRNGKFGINTITPNKDIDIVGNMYVSDSLTIVRKSRLNDISADSIETPNDIYGDGHLDGEGPLNIQGNLNMINGPTNIFGDIIIGTMNGINIDLATESSTTIMNNLAIGGSTILNNMNVVDVIVNNNNNNNNSIGTNTSENTINGTLLVKNIDSRNLLINGPIFNYSNYITDDEYDMKLVKGDSIKRPSYYMSLFPGIYTEYSIIDLTNQNTSIRLISYDETNNIPHIDNKPIPVEQCLVQTIVPISHTIDNTTNTGVFNKSYNASYPLIKQYIYSNDNVWIRVASINDTWTRGAKLNNTNLDGTSFISKPQDQFKEKEVNKLKALLVSPAYAQTIESAVSKMKCNTVKKFMCSK